jgi:hypothetical protein
MGPTKQDPFLLTGETETDPASGTLCISNILDTRNNEQCNIHIILIISLGKRYGIKSG